MAVLDLYKKRLPHTIYLEIGGQKKAYKIPTQYLAEEVERILELQDELNKQKNLVVEEGSVESVEGVARFWKLIYTQLLILFQHYQPEIDIEFLEKNVGKEEALNIIEFHTSEHNKGAEEDLKRSKKKLN